MKIHPDKLSAGFNFFLIVVSTGFNEKKPKLPLNDAEIQQEM
jgi:hypothetical protein